MATVVVAEDNPEHQRLIAAIVRRLRHEVVVVDDGRQALEAVRVRRPDLLIADVDMPHLDGIRLCGLLRDDPDLATLPVVLVTAFLAPTDPDLTATGATAVVRKPFTVRQLAETVSHCLDATTITSEARRPASDDAAGPTAADSSSFVDALLLALDVGVCVCDARGRLLLLNESLTSFFGDEYSTIPLPEWPGRFHLRHHDGTPLTVAELPLSRALSGETVEHADILADDLQHRPHWLAVNAHPIRDAGGLLIGAVAAVHDVTAEHQAYRYRQCKSAVLEVLARGGDTTTTAAEVLEIMGTQLGWPFIRLWLVDPVSDMLLPAGSYRAPAARPVPMPKHLARGHGLAGTCWERSEPVWVPDIGAPDSPVVSEVTTGSTYRAAGAVPVYSGTTVVGVLSFFSDDHQEPEPALFMLLTGITGHIGAYLERRRSEELALRLAASVDEYVALVGHELRTPLTSIAAYTELITHEPATTPLGEIQSLLDVVVRNNGRLLALVDQLLDLTALESGHARITAVPVDLAGIVTTAVTAARSAATTHHITLHTDLPSRLTVPGDPERLRQVVDHLLDNAVKYSPDGSGVDITLTAPDAAVLTVTNPGGVPTDEQSHLVCRLYRGSNARHTGIPGAGLGLTLSRAIVDQHHGTLTVAACPPSGMTVTVRLPRNPAR